MTTVPAAVPADQAEASAVLAPRGDEGATVATDGRPRASRWSLAGLFWNPIVAKELRSRVRGWHAVALLTGYLCVIGAFGYLVYSSALGTSVSAVQVGSVGAELFKSVAAAVMVTLALVVPGLVAPSVSGERERQTLDLLLVTRLRPARILTGKLLAALAFVLLLVVACLPLFSVAFLLGGAGLSQVLGLLAFTMVSCLCVGCLSLFVSTASRHISTSTVASYLAMLVLTVGPLLGGYAIERAFYPSNPNYGWLPSSAPGALPTPAGAVYAISPVIGADGLFNNGLCNLSGGPLLPGGSFVAPFPSTCSTVGQYTTSFGLLGNWQAWQVSLAAEGVIAAGALGASVAVLRRRGMS